MKKIIIAFALGLTSISISYASNDPKLTNEIKHKVIDDIDSDNIKNYNESFIIVNFNIIDNRIKMKKIKGSSSYELKKYILSKLTHLNIESNYDTNKEYKYKFIFNN